MVLFVDVGDLGPDYQLGHAHADTLSYEMSLFGKRFVVNSGTSVYEKGVLRSWQRSTGAHSTLELEGRNSSEVWAGFRVARRARVCDLKIEESGGSISISASHDGYCNLKHKPKHVRVWRIGESSLEITDKISQPNLKAKARTYFHPDVLLNYENAILIDEKCHRTISWEYFGKEASVIDSEWFPCFGVAVPNQCLESQLKVKKSTLRFFWKA